jgi:hypothetical protein
MSRGASSTLSSEDVAAFAHACARIASEASDAEGFVPLNKLLERFHAQLLIRPLLVEGMLATQGAVQSEWLVLVDSELYGITAVDVEGENAKQPLPSRLRFTVAHELVHSLAFRSSEFGISLRTSINTDDSKAAVVAAIERITDRLTPLLLLPEVALTEFFKRDTVRTSASDFAELGRKAGVSRRTLIGRLRNLSHADANRVSRYSLNNIAICIAEWREKHAVIRSAPAFARYERNIFPEFLLDLPNHDRLPGSLAFSDLAFAPCGGELGEVETELFAGTTGVPRAQKIRVHCSLEQTARTVGTEFYLVVRGLPLAQPARNRAQAAR